MGQASFCWEYPDKKGFFRKAEKTFFAQNTCEKRFRTRVRTLENTGISDHKKPDMKYIS